MFDRKEVKRKTVLGIFFKLFERVGTQCIGLIVSIVLARLLEPELVGVISLAEMFILFFGVVASHGFGNSLIQNKNADEIDFSTALFSGIILSGLLYLIIYFAAPFIEKYYNYSIYNFCKIIRLLGLTVFVYGVKSIQQALASKRLQFKYFFYTSFISLTISGVCGILMAIKGYGIWALVAYNLINEILSVIVLGVLLHWHPKLIFSFAKLKGILDYGWKMIVVGLLNAGYLQIRSLIIAKRYSSNELAFFNKGLNLAKLVPEEIGSTFMAVLFPVYSNFIDKNLLKNELQKTVKISSYIVFPAVVGMFVVADNLIITLLTEKWSNTIIFLRIFCVSYLFYIIESIYEQGIKALGRSDILLLINIMKKVIGVITILITYRRGTVMISLGYLIAMLFGFLISILTSKVLFTYTIKEQLKDLFTPFIISATMGAVCYVVGFCNYASYITLILQILSGVIVYFILSNVFKIEAYKFCIETIRELKDKKHMRVL